MSYDTQSQLELSGEFQARNRACATQQASGQFTDHIADAVLRGDPDVILCFVRLAAAGPGIADKVDNGDGTIDQAKCTDADLLSLTQAHWPTVAELYPPAVTGA